MSSVTYFFCHVSTSFDADECASSTCKAKNDCEREISPHHIILEDRKNLARRVRPVAHDPKWYDDSEEPNDV